MPMVAATASSGSTMTAAISPASSRSLRQLGAAQPPGVGQEPVGQVPAAAERLEHPDAQRRLLDHGGEVADLVLGPPGGRR